MKPIPTELKLAGMLFGNQNLRKNISKINSPIPMAVYCEDKVKEFIQGASALDFSDKMCKEFYPAPVDIGRCITKNSVHYFNLSDISLQYDFSSIDRAHKNAKNTFVISNDVFGALNQKSYRVNTIKYFCTKINIIMNYTFLIQCELKCFFFLIGKAQNDLNLTKTPTSTCQTSQNCNFKISIIPYMCCHTAQLITLIQSYNLNCCLYYYFGKYLSYI